MKKFIVHTGFPGSARPYSGENILSVAAEDFARGMRWFRLENNVWIKEIAPERYITDWNDEERWGRVEALDCDASGAVRSAQDVGFMILLADRSKGLF